MPEPRTEKDAPGRPTGQVPALPGSVKPRVLLVLIFGGIGRFFQTDGPGSGERAVTAEGNGALGRGWNQAGIREGRWIRSSDDTGTPSCTL